LKVLLIGKFVEPPFSEGEVNTVLNWSRALHQAGTNVTVLSLSSKYSGYQKIFGIHFEYVKTKGPRFQNNIIDLFSIQKEALNQLDFDVAHFASTADGVSSIPMLTLLKLQKHKIVNSYHTNLLVKSTRLFRNLMFNMMTVPSRRMRNNFLRRQVSPQKIRIIPPCVDENSFRPRDRFKIREQLGIERDSFTVFTTGHFKRGRLLAPLIHTIRELSDEGKKIQLLVGWTGLGDTEYISEIFSIARKNKIVKIIQPTDKINLYYNASDIYVLSADFDYVIETPLSLMEALSSGTPAIAFDINASSEIIKDGINGYVIRNKNFSEVKLKLNYLMGNMILLRELSRNARNLALNAYTYEKVGHQLLGLYRELVAIN
jgi:glycosyltransferase involved in cell wall biosynthesis